MDAANPLCRFFMLAFGLLAVIGCRSDDSGSRARGQSPQDPLAPIAPPPLPPTGAYPAYPPTAPQTGAAVPGAPVAPTLQTGAAAPVAPVAIGSAVPGSPVPPELKSGGPGGGAPSGVRTVSLDEMLARCETRVQAAAIVGENNVITVQEVKESVWQQYEALAKLEGHERQIKERELYTKALRDIIERELILDEMYGKLKKANKNAVIDEIKELATQMADKQVRDLKKRTNTKSDEELNKWLSHSGLTLAILRRQWERQIMAQQYINSMLKERGKVGLGEIRDYYDRHTDEFRTADRVKWQHIFVSFGNPPNHQAAQARMEAIRQRVAAGEDFAALSMQFDEGYAKQQKGFGTGEKRIQTENKQEDWIQPADLEPTVWALKAGEVSGVVQTPTGYHLVKVIEREYASVRPYDPKLQGEIREKLNRATFETDRAKMVLDLWRKGVVRVNDE